MTKDGRPNLAGVIGWPVSQSLSPLLHGHWLHSLAIEGHYVPLAVRPDSIAKVIETMPAMGFRGTNITVPHKETVFQLVNRKTLLAQHVGAVNLLRIDEKGRLEGDNTDVAGFQSHLATIVPGWRTAFKTAVVLGAGGAASAVLVGLIDSQIEQIYIANRDQQRAERLVERLGDVRLHVCGWADRFSVTKGAELLVNTTSLGMKGQPALDMNLSLMAPEAAIYDIVYTPLETALLRQARQRGMRAIDGLGMLIHQAVPSFEAFFGHRPIVDDITISLLRSHLGKREETA